MSVLQPENAKICSECTKKLQDPTQVNPSPVKPVTPKVEGVSSSTVKVETQVNQTTVDPVPQLIHSTSELERILTSTSPCNSPTRTPTLTISQLVEIKPTKEVVSVDHPDNNQPISVKIEIINKTEKIPEIIQDTKNRDRSPVAVLKLQKLSQEEIEFYTKDSNYKCEDKKLSNKSEVR